MRRKTEIACWDTVEAVLDCLSRETVLLQNMAAHTVDTDDTLRRLQGLAAAAHRAWREANGQLARTFITAWEREDISAFIQTLATLCDTVCRTAMQWRGRPFSGTQDWTARLTNGSHLLRQLTDELPQFRQENALSDTAEALYDLRRDADRQWGEEGERLRGQDAAYAAAFHHACCAFAAAADTAEWLVMKNL